MLLYLIAYIGSMFLYVIACIGLMFYLASVNNKTANTTESPL